MTVIEMKELCDKLIKEGKSDYIMTCEGSCVLLDNEPIIYDKLKYVEF